MDIKGLNTNSLRPDSQNPGVKGRDESGNTASRAPASGNASAPNNDSVTLTGAAQAMNAAAGAGDTAPFDAARVAELREAISSGNYPVDNQQLADRMIDLESLLR
ncbi:MULTISPECIES: flagellar biosynthesis anti-sigma factor FlgM [Thioalkalivibrio]|uniref:flagellar biosynthesis anti-sigma factor FlgM n=1 Tax=Thioalkalivibrio TaxID=106633 RepID=UPI000365893A|nr:MULTISPECIES: flagellar biosynthesis anti-sigma factor FlgM [Thioalkalivibrio]OOC51123.1 flagellar biosynthesis anti-sigma factor FlgM [Thioalkalivibrio versutus]